MVRGKNGIVLVPVGICSACSAIVVGVSEPGIEGGASSLTVLDSVLPVGYRYIVAAMATPVRTAPYAARFMRRNASVRSALEDVMEDASGLNRRRRSSDEP